MNGKACWCLYPPPSMADVSQEEAEAAHTEQRSHRATPALTLMLTTVSSAAHTTLPAQQDPTESLPNSKPAHEGARSCTFTEMPLVRNREGEMAVLMGRDCFFTIHRVQFVKHPDGIPGNKRHWQEKGGKKLRVKQHRRKRIQHKAFRGSKMQFPSRFTSLYLPVQALPRARGLRRALNSTSRAGTNTGCSDKRQFLL